MLINPPKAYDLEVKYYNLYNGLVFLKSLMFLCDVLFLIKKLSVNFPNLVAQPL